MNHPTFPNYIIRSVSASPVAKADWNDPSWNSAETLEIKSFRPESSVHQPRTFARLLYDKTGIHGIFHVKDRFVRCTRTKYLESVWKDSCVEFFVQPKNGKGYFNFEFNCGGAFLCNYITDPTRAPEGFKEFVKVPETIAKNINTYPSLPGVTDPEISEPVEWNLQFFIPFSVLEQFVGPLGNVPGQKWRGNFFKCADESSHPHWGSWSPVDELNFHLPRCFGNIGFEA